MYTCMAVILIISQPRLSGGGGGGGGGGGFKEDVKCQIPFFKLGQSFQIYFLLR